MNRLANPTSSARRRSRSLALPSGVRKSFHMLPFASGTTCMG
jgi:hypothetical protein